MEDEEMSTEDIARAADDKIDALINLLIKKKIITDEEMGKALDELYEEE